MSIHVNVGGQNKKTSSSWMKINGEWKKGTFWNNVQGTWKKHSYNVKQLYMSFTNIDSKNETRLYSSDLKLDATSTSLSYRIIHTIPEKGTFILYSTGALNEVDRNLNIVKSYNSTDNRVGLFDKDNKRYAIVVKDYQLSIYDIENPSYKTSFSYPPNNAFGRYVLSPDSKYLYIITTTSQDGRSATLFVINIQNINTDIQATTIYSMSLNEGVSIAFGENSVYIGGQTAYSAHDDIIWYLYISEYTFDLKTRIRIKEKLGSDGSRILNVDKEGNMYIWEPRSPYVSTDLEDVCKYNNQFAKVYGYQYDAPFGVPDTTQNTFYFIKNADKSLNKLDLTTGNIISTVYNTGIDTSSIRTAIF